MATSTSSVPPTPPTPPSAGAADLLVHTRGRALAPVADPLPAALHCATPDARLVDVPAWRALAIDGEGLRADDALARACATLRAAGAALARDTPFPTGPLEVVWWLDGAPAHESTPARWRWRLRLAVPADAGAVRLEGAGVFLEDVAASRMMRALRRGGDDSPAFTGVVQALHDRALRPGDHWAEVFLTDPLDPTSPNAKAVVLVAVAD